MNRRSMALLVVLAGLLVAAQGCKHDEDSGVSSSRSRPKAHVQDKSLYDRLGGEPAIRAVVDDLVPRAAGDERVNFTRKGHPNQWDPSPANIEKLKKHLVQFIGSATGGPQKYEGKDLVTAHKGMEISEAEFNAFADDLKATLDKLKVPDKEQKDLLTVIGSTKGSVVGQ